MTTGHFTVRTEEQREGYVNAGDRPCDCSACEWRGFGRDTTDIGEIALTPGFPLPVGRCPKCEAPSYVRGGLYDMAHAMRQQLMWLTAYCTTLALSAGALEAIDADFDQIAELNGLIARSNVVLKAARDGEAK